MPNPRDDTLNPLCQPGPLQRHSGEELGLALAHSLRTHTHIHMHLSGNTGAGHKEKKAFFAGQEKQTTISHLYVRMWERKKRKRERGKERDTYTHTIQTERKRKSSNTSCVWKFKTATKR